MRPDTSAFVVGSYLIWVALGTLGFAFVNAVLLSHGLADAPKQPEGGRALFVAAVQTEVVELLAGIPGLDLDESLRLKPPLDYRDRWTGVLLVTFKIAIVATLVPVVKAITSALERPSVSVEDKEELLRVEAMLQARRTAPVRRRFLWKRAG
jgi:hypothetical protein